MSLVLEVDGVHYEGFTDISVRRSLEDISGVFNFSATSQALLLFPIKVNQACRVLIDNTPVMTGFIEYLSSSMDASGHTISLQGRDVTCDIVDSSVNGNTEFKAPINLVQIIRNVLNYIGLTDIKVINNAGTIADFQQGEIVAADTGMGTFEFIDQYCRKRQVLATTDGMGNVVLTRASGQAITTLLLNEIDGINNNILFSSVTYDFVNRYNRYIVRSQLNGSGEYEADISPEAMVSSSGQSSDPVMRSNRVLVINAESSNTNQTAVSRAIWENNIRRARSISYSCDVQGFYAESDGLLWQPNYLVHVIDPTADINGQMLIKAVTYRLSVQGGSITELELVVKDAYTLQASQDEVESRANQLGEGIIYE